MYTIEVLFSLIHAMTKSEKRYFRMASATQKGEKDYLILFNLLEETPLLDDKLYSQLDHLYPGTSIEPARKHLYKVLMKSLRQFESDKNVETRIMNILQDSRILYGKGLISQSFEQLDRVKEVSLKHEKFIYYILAARQELQYLVRSQFAGVDEYHLLEKL